MPRLSLSSLAFLTVLALPGVGLARDDTESSKEKPSRENTESSEEGPSMLSYAFEGLVVGAGFGLATGYLSTGPHYQSNEWRKLVIGTGIGAISGLGVGLILAVVDTSMSGPGVGGLVLRDMGYGEILGTLSGAVIGTLVFVGTNHAKDILIGATIGTLVGAGVGVAFGIIEGVSARTRYDRGKTAAGDLRFSLAAGTTVRGAPVIMPAVYGSF